MMNNSNTQLFKMRWKRDCLALNEDMSYYIHSSQVSEIILEDGEERWKS